MYLSSNLIQTYLCAQLLKKDHAEERLPGLNPNGRIHGKPWNF
jgi:hypothetical protein